MPHLQTQVTTQIALRDLDNRILLLRRNKAGGWFTLPGGTVDEGETVIEALEREIIEETGLKIEVDQPIWVWQSNHIGKDLLGIVFSAKEKISSDIKIKLSKEHDLYKWVKFEDLMIDDTVDPYIKKSELNN